VGDVLISYTVSDAITGCSNSASHPVNVHSITLPVSLINFSARLIDKNGCSEDDLGQGSWVVWVPAKGIGNLES
jgi:hypothetical protein